MNVSDHVEMQVEIAAAGAELRNERISSTWFFRGSRVSRATNRIAGVAGRWVEPRAAARGAHR
jgi:hypothetical protein